MKKHTIILIDDDKFITDMYSEKLQQEGFNIFCANNGNDGAKLIALYKPDLILLDIVMPLGDGFYVLEEIKKNKETKDTPIIILTNLANEIDRKETEKMGANDYVIKANSTPSKIIEKINSLLGQKTAKLSVG